MTGRVLTSLTAVLLLLLGGCAPEEDPTPSIEEQTTTDAGGTDDGTEEQMSGVQVQQGTVATLGDVRVGVYSIVAGTLAQLSIDTPDEVIENTELRVGDELEVGGYTIALTEAGSTFARVLVVDPDGTEVRR